jgi:hypothetical protein
VAGRQVGEEYGHHDRSEARGQEGRVGAGLSFMGPPPERKAKQGGKRDKTDRPEETAPVEMRRSSW